MSDRYYWPVDDTVEIAFNTVDGDGASATFTGDVDNVRVYKDGGTTQRSSASGITLTKDFNSVTGAHRLTIDLSDNTDDGFYEADSRYEVMLNGITLDSQAVNAWIDEFAIGTDPAIATAQSDLDKITGSDGVTLATAQGNYAPAKAGDEMDLVDAPNATAIAAIGAALEAMILDEGDATALLAAISAKVEEFLINEGDSTATLAAIAAAVWAEATRTLTGAQSFDLTGDITGNLSGSVGSVTGAVGSVAGHTPQTGDSFARLGAPAGASVSADIAAVKTDTSTLLGRITSTLFSGITSLAEWLGALAGKQVADSTARTEIRATGAGSGTFDETDDSLEAISDSGGGGPTAEEIREEIDANSTLLASIIEDTGTTLPSQISGISSGSGSSSDSDLSASDIAAAALNPKRVTGDEGTVEERTIEELIAADRYSKAQQADAPGYGVRISKMRFPDTQE